MTRPTEQFARTLHETAREWRATLDRRLRPLGLSQAKWLTLLHLARASSPLTQKQLASRLGVEAATVVGLLDRLQADGWIERRPSVHDRRSKTVHLTRGSASIVEQIDRVAAAVRSDLLAAVSDDELNLCLQILARIHARAQALAAGEEICHDH